MMLPPPPYSGNGTRPRAGFDTECFPNFWLLKLRPIGGATYTFSIKNGERFSPESLAFIRHLFDCYTVISFYGIGYDVPMLRGVFAGYTTDQLKWLNDQLIVERVKPWELGMGEWVPADHIDIMEVAPGAGSQKQYAGRIHCKRMQDLPYDPGMTLDDAQMAFASEYCDNDLDVLLALFRALAPQLRQRERLGQRYGLDLRSKSDAQVAEAVLKARCEQATGRRIYKPRIDWNLRFTYNAPSFLSFTLPQLQRAFELVKQSVFTINPPLSMREHAPTDTEVGKCIGMPPQLEGLEISIGNSIYKMGVGGLHSQEKKLVAVSNATHLLRMPDVASYYPNLMVNAGAFPAALGSTFVTEYEALKDERLHYKHLAKRLKAAGFAGTVEYEDAKVGDEGGKVNVNGPFGKTGSPYSVLFAPEMLIQTTITGQLSLLMLIEWHECYGIPVISANTDGLVIYCPRDRLHISEALIVEWQRRTGLEMETDDYVAIYARDVNNYFAIKGPDDVKRKGEYAKAGLVEKKNPDSEICSDAVADFLAKGIPIEQTITQCLDIRKFVTIQKVNGGGVKMWGDGPRKGEKVRDMIPVLEANGWHKAGHGKWSKPGRTRDAADHPLSTAEAHAACFMPRRPDYLGKVIRWYYGTNAPGPILYASNGNTVGMSYGAQPCMTLPDEFPADIDYAWYVKKSQTMLKDIGYFMLTATN